MKADKITKGIVDYLKLEGLTELLPEISAQLDKLAAEMDNGAMVESARELSSKEKTEINNKLKTEFRWKGKVTYVINEEIIGGFKLTLSDQVLDMSVAGKLNKLYEQI
jgi:F0F1-type ATP synthase delta subunit